MHILLNAGASYSFLLIIICDWAKEYKRTETGNGVATVLYYFPFISRGTMLQVTRLLTESIISFFFCMQNEKSVHFLVGFSFHFVNANSH